MRSQPDDGSDEGIGTTAGAFERLIAPVRAAIDGVSGRPALVGICGGVGVGKSTLADDLAASLPGLVEVVSTDAFLHPNAVLSARGLLDVKGYPDTFDHEALFAFVERGRVGQFPMDVPVYSHVRYDRIDGEAHHIARADVMIIEGLTLLQDVLVSAGGATRCLGDLLDITVYVEADTADTKRWWLERFLRLRDQIGADPESFLHDYATISDDEAATMGDWVWSHVNGPNLERYIAPGRARADVIVRKGPDHTFDVVIPGR